MIGAGNARTVRLFDAHCHLQDGRISALAPQLLRSAVGSGVLRFAVNGVSENDWHVVKEMADEHPCVVPCFGLHPWFVAERSPNWLSSLKRFFEVMPAAAVGEIGLDKGWKNIDFSEQIEVFRQQLALAKELERPVSVHCVRAYGDLLKILQDMKPFPAGVLLHSFLGPAEMVTSFANLGSYFSFSGFLMSMELRKAKRMIKSVPLERILLETDAPDASPKMNSGDIRLFGETDYASWGLPDASGNLVSMISALKNGELNHPANLHQVDINAAEDGDEHDGQGEKEHAQLYRYRRMIKMQLIKTTLARLGPRDEKARGKEKKRDRDPTV